MQVNLLVATIPPSVNRARSLTAGLLAGMLSSLLMAPNNLVLYPSSAMAANEMNEFHVFKTVHTVVM